MRDEKPDKETCEGRLKAQVVVEFIIRDSQIVDVKATQARLNYLFN